MKEDIEEHEIVTATLLSRDPDDSDLCKSSFTQRVLINLRSKTYDCVVGLGIILLLTGINVVCFLYCTECLFLIFGFCLCCCLCVPTLNVPLWISVILLVISGYTFTYGKFAIVWNSR